jgi:hypothetical protein
MVVTNDVGAPEVAGSRDHHPIQVVVLSNKLTSSLAKTPTDRPSHRRAAT